MAARFDMRVTLESGAIKEAVEVSSSEGRQDPQAQQFNNLFLAWLQAKTGYIQDFQGFIQGEGKQLLGETIEEVFKTRAYGTWPARQPPHKPHPLLRLTGDYFNALLNTIPEARGTKTLERHAFNFNLDLSQFDPQYPLFHEFGTSRIPKRPVLSFIVSNARFIKRYTNAYHRWSRKAVEESTKRELAGVHKSSVVYPFTAARLSQGRTVGGYEQLASARFANRGRRRGATKRKLAGTARGGRPRARRTAMGTQPQERGGAITRRPGESAADYMRRQRENMEQERLKGIELRYQLGR